MSSLQSHDVDCIHIHDVIWCNPGVVKFSTHEISTYSCLGRATFHYLLLVDSALDHWVPFLACVGDEVNRGLKTDTWAINWGQYLSLQRTTTWRNRSPQLAFSHWHGNCSLLIDLGTSHMQLNAEVVHVVGKKLHMCSKFKVHISLSLLHPKCKTFILEVFLSFFHPQKQPAIQ